MGRADGWKHDVSPSQGLALMFLTGMILVLSAAFFWAGFKAPPHPLQHQSKAGFVMALGLAGLAGYFAWRESRTVAELAEFIHPVPEITDVAYVPTPEEVAALGSGLSGSAGAKDGIEQSTKSWLLSSALTPDSVLAFYRCQAPLRGWAVDSDSSGWLMMSQGDLRMSVFVSDGEPKQGSRVLYSLSSAGR